VWGVGEFDALFEPVGASVFFGHASPNSIPFGVVDDVLATVVDDWAGFADGFGPVHLGGVATVDEEQVGSAFARCPVGPNVKEVGVLVGLVHS
jgi:hypothetical protein